MKYGLCGAQRVGKTTLAQEYAKVSGLKFVKTTTSGILESIGMDAKVQYPIEQRMYAQEIILKGLNEQWMSSDNCIFDRTPLDVLMYMEADVLRDFPQDTELEDRYLKYRSQCFTAALTFGRTVLVQPGIKIVEDAGSAPGSRPYMEHLNSLLLGYIADLCLRRDFRAEILSRDTLDLQARIAFLVRAFE